MNATPRRAGSTNRQSSRITVARLILSLAPVVFGVVWGIRETTVIPPAAIAPSDGFRYTALVPRSAYGPFFHVEGDTLRCPRRASTGLFENRRRLGPSHQPHDDIREDGGGQFSHWGSTLYFSASDSSDPRSNGRTYSIVTSATLSFEVVWIWLVCVLVPAGLAYWRGPSREVFPVVGRAGTILSAALVAGLYLAVVWGSLDPSSSRAGLLGLWAAALLGAAILAWQSGAALGSAGLYRDICARWSALLAVAGRPFGLPGWRGWTARAATLVIPFAVFVAMLRTALPPPILLASYSSFTPVALPAGIALWGCQLRRDWLGTLAVLTLTLALFALPLAAVWQHVGLHYNAIGGLLPFSDASAYYYDARRLIDGHHLGWSARRPLFVGFLSTLLALTRQNLQVSLAVLVAVNAIACFLFARELRASHGPAAAAVATIVLFLFYRVEGGSGTTLTENLGFAMGTVAFAALWRASRENDLRSICTGMGLLTAGLMARAGALFVLPALVLAAAWAFRRDRGWLHVGIGASAAVAIAAAFTLGLGRVLSDPAGGQTSFSNFSYSLYGLVVGGKGWRQVLVDHPGAQEGAQIYSLALQAFRAHPMGLVEGSVRMWGTYFQPSLPYHAFAFVRDATWSRPLQISCYFLSAIALALAVRRYRQRPYALLLAATIGHLASIPFVPPMDAGLRVYAATMPILVILISIGAAAVLQSIRSVAGAPRQQGPATAGVRQPRSAETFGLALAFIVFAGPLCVFYASRPAGVRTRPCPDGSVAVHLRVSNGSLLRIVGNLQGRKDVRIAVPEIRERDLRTSVLMTEIKNDASLYRAGQTMVNGYDMNTGRYVWLVAPGGLLPGSPGVVQVCGHDSRDPLSRQYGVFYADTIGRAEAEQPSPTR